MEFYTSQSMPTYEVRDIVCYKAELGIITDWFSKVLGLTINMAVSHIKTHQKNAKKESPSEH
jgi:hypothetical protein